MLKFHLLHSFLLKRDFFLQKLQENCNMNYFISFILIRLKKVGYFKPKYHKIKGLVIIL
jgi:hypothetical protein